MRKGVMKKVISLGLILVLMSAMLTGCRFGFASDPDDPNEEEKEIPIDTSVDTFEYDSSLSGTNITLLNSKAPSWGNKSRDSGGIRENGS